MYLPMLAGSTDGLICSSYSCSPRRTISSAVWFTGIVVTFLDLPSICRLRPRLARGEGERVEAEALVRCQQLQLAAAELGVLHQVVHARLVHDDVASAGG